MSITYCERWWISEKRPITLLDAEVAQLRHETRQPYVALIGDAERPIHVIQVAGEWVSVKFMDNRLRQYLCYQFKEKQPGRLFLKAATYWSFEDESEAPSSTKLFNFHEDGSIVIAELDAENKQVREFESTGNTSCNWEAYPKFGEYDAICKVDREKRR